MRILLCVGFVLSLVICGCSSENVKTDPKNAPPPQTGFKRAQTGRVPTVD
jgi:hypothetical protein